eukprot:TRINITY_DN10998_c0_g1_i1.p1 TRINITY_DN10998_c0_g1~~TRINITY_DN10998_c0_g1_i1.p1  ORF type:complete len:176 (+),score=29.71 TRINITY_DN10998_c0_g1_i1:50-577(+)
MGHDDQPNQYNVFRDTPVRYLGYANEIGESFRKLTSTMFVRATYGVSITYALSDAVFLSRRMNQKHEQSSNKLRRAASANAFFETIVWQLAASVIIPGFVINRIVFFSSRALIKTSANQVATPLQKWGPTVAGLGSIPLIIKPIDKAVDYGMEKLYNPLSGFLIRKLVGVDIEMD